MLPKLIKLGGSNIQAQFLNSNFGLLSVVNDRMILTQRSSLTVPEEYSGTIILIYSIVICGIFICITKANILKFTKVVQSPKVKHSACSVRNIIY